MSQEPADQIEDFGAYAVHSCVTAEGEPRIGIEVYSDGEELVGVMHLDCSQALALAELLTDFARKAVTAQATKQ